MMWIPKIVLYLATGLLAIIVATSVALRVIAKREREQRELDNGEYNRVYDRRRSPSARKTAGGENEIRKNNHV